MVPHVIDELKLRNDHQPQRKMLTRTAVLRLAVPVILAQAASATTGVVDTLVMGLQGDAADLAAVAVASVVFSFLYWSFGFLRMSTTGLAAQAAGRDDADEVRAALFRALILGLLIGLAILALAAPLRTLAFASFATTAQVEALADGYFGARVWGAPAYLGGIAVSGWLLGTGRTGALLSLQLILNGTNAVLDVWFVAGFGWGPAGIGAGTAIAEWVALAFGLVLVRRSLVVPRGLFDRSRLSALFSANRDILLRTLALLFSFAWFVRSGTLISTATTAGNEVLLQFIAVAAFVLDGFAFVAEKEAGEAHGAGDRARLLRAMRLTSEFALICGLALSLLYFLGGGWVLETFILDAEARKVALAHLPWCAAVPLVGVVAWQLDGIFIGTTQGRALRNAALISAALYVACDMLLRPAFGNHGVWAAFLSMYVFRAVTLAIHVPSLLATVALGASSATVRFRVRHDPGGER